jgi:hypothetical protein
MNKLAALSAAAFTALVSPAARAESPGQPACKLAGIAHDWEESLAYRAQKLRLEGELIDAILKAQQGPLDPTRLSLQKMQRTRRMIDRERPILELGIRTAHGYAERQGRLCDAQMGDRP